MRIAIISDTHFGDDHSQLAYIPAGKEEAVPGEKYNVFRQAVKDQFKKCDYLILAGDILDFSIAPYQTAYKCAKVFFEEIKKDGLTEDVIYIAGNHDADIWHTVQHQRHVIDKIAKGEEPEAFRHSVAGILDDRSGVPEEDRFTLDGVTAYKKGTEKKYGGMFLDGIAKGITFNDGIAKGITFNFAYPNLYIVTDNESVLVTHGHYLEPYWSFMGELAEKIAGDDLNLGDIDIEEMVQLNFPLNQLACTGIGQAGKLTEKVIRRVELDVKKSQFNRIERYLNRLEKVVDDLTDFNWFKERVADFLVDKIKDELIAEIEKIRRTRGGEDFFSDEKVKEKLLKFYNASLMEINLINGKSPFNNRRLPAPRKIIFGHTHDPVSWKNPNTPGFNFGSVHNTGGWLIENSEFKGAEMFFYETGKDFSSKLIR